MRSRGLIADSVPPELANQVSSLVLRLSESDWRKFHELFDRVWVSLGLESRALRYETDQKLSYLQAEIDTEEVDVFLDVLEMLVQASAGLRWFDGHQYLIEASEEAFVLARFGYRFVGDEIVEAGKDIENQAVDEARESLLRDSRFADAEEKFVSALGKATSARGAQYPEAVHAAVSAVEEVCRELLGDSKILLDRALDKLRAKYDLDPNLVSLIKKLYHLRGDLQGAAHGAAPGSEHTAKFAIHASAAAMLYLIAECA